MKIYKTVTIADSIEKTAELVSFYTSDITRSIFIFCEDKETLAFERAIAELIGGSFNITVDSFSRYVSAKKEGEYLSKSSSALVIRRLLDEKADSLERLSAGAVNLPAEIYELISQLKSAKVDPSQIKSIIDAEGGSFALKLKDIYTLYLAYENYLTENNLTDANSFLSLMPSLLSQDVRFKNAKVIISGISAFTKQSLDIVIAISKLCDVDFVVNAVDAPAFLNESYNKLVELFPNAQIIDCPTQSGPQLKLVKALYDDEGLNREGEFSDKIRLIEAASPKVEAENVAKRIRYEVVENGKRYKDFVIACSDVSEYADLYKEVFSDFEIPLFCDQKRSLAFHPTVKLVLALIRAARQNFLPEALCELACCRLFADSENSSLFQSYVTKNAFSRKSIVKPFTLQDDNLEIIEALRQKTVEAVSLIKSCSTVKEYIDCILSILSSCGGEEKTAEISESLKALKEDTLAEFNLRGYSETLRLLSEIKIILGDKKVALSELENIFAGAVTKTELALIPEYLDNVFLGDYKAAGLKKTPIMFFIGLNGKVPKIMEDASLMCDKDLLKMEGYKCVIEPKVEIVNLREREVFARSIACFTEFLVLSKCRIALDGSPSTQSEIIEYITAAFSDKNKKLVAVSFDDIKDAGLPIKNDFYGYIAHGVGIKQAAKDVEDFLERKNSDLSSLFAFYTIMKGLGKNNLIDEIIKCEHEAFAKLGEENSKIKALSATALENYFNCPYKYFVSNLLRLKERMKGSAESFELGNIIHSVLEKFVPHIANLSNADLAVKMGERLFDEEIKSPLYVRYFNKSQYEVLFGMLKEETVKECKNIYEDFKQSSFKPLGAEMTFSDLEGADFSALELKTEKGVVKLRGKIDRVDAYNSYVRVVDYKTGNVDDKIKDESLYTGRSIQLYLYMNVLKGMNFVPSGLYYYAINNSYKKPNESFNSFVGKTLDMPQVLEASEKSAQVNLQSQADLNNYINYAKRVAESGASEILEGVFEASPYEKACDYCKYNGMCGFDGELNSCRKFKLEKNYIKKVEEENNG